MSAVLPHEIAARYEALGCWPGETLHERAVAVAARTPSRIALIDGSTRLSFADLTARADRLAAAFAARGVQAADVVSWIIPNRWEAAAVHLACARLGAVSNPLNPAFRRRELAFVAANAKPALIVAMDEWRGFEHAAAARALDAAPVITVGELGSLPRARPPAAPPTDPAATAVLLYTSGTTSDPKGVRLSHRALLCEIESFTQIHSLKAGDRYLGGSPVCHIAGLVYGILTPFALGTSTVLLDRWDPARALHAIEAERATFQTGPPTLLQTLADAAAGARADTSSFRLFSTGGASIPTEAVRAAGKVLGCSVKRAYGSTEVPTLTATTLDDPEDERMETDGRLIGHGEIRIVRADGTDAGNGHEGEILARAPEMFDGYTSAALNAESFIDGGWYRTGDLGVVDARGLLRVTGRLKDIIIRGGENISVKELEDLLSEHPAVADVAIVGMPDDRLGERVCAFLSLRDGTTIGFNEMTGYLTSRGIAEHKLPERLEIRSALPKTESGKIRKNELRDELRR